MVNQHDIYKEEEKERSPRSLSILPKREKKEMIVANTEQKKRSFFQ
jgi:hypothetical protein